jgi:hypothetical protein
MTLLSMSEWAPKLTQALARAANQPAGGRSAAEPVAEVRA